MTGRQTSPERWLIVTGSEALRDLRELSHDCGLFVLPEVSARQRVGIRRLARKQRLSLIEEKSGAPFRVHNMRELRQALGKRSAMILISPIYPTGSHPDWLPMPRMRTATLARLARRKAIALGGMNEERYAKIARLGFIGWAGISAFRT